MLTICTHAQKYYVHTTDIVYVYMCINNDVQTMNKHMGLFKVFSFIL